MSSRRNRRTSTKAPATPTRSRRSIEPTLAKIVVPIGVAVMVQYKDAAGVIRAHAFRKGNATVYATRDGRQLIVAPVAVRNKEIHDDS